MGCGGLGNYGLFWSSDDGDYSLQEGSPCIDSEIIMEDMDYCGSAPDMGAYEHESEYDFNLGDVNFDNVINILDVVLMVSFILGEPADEYEYSAVDMNDDGELDVLDVVILVDNILNP